MTTGSGRAIGIPYENQTFTNLTVTGTLAAASQEISGGQIGASSTATIGFFGATVTTQPAAIAAVTTAALTSVTTTASTTSEPFGYSTSTQADAIVTLVNALAVRAAALTTQGNSIDEALTTLGLVA